MTRTIGDLLTLRERLAWQLSLMPIEFPVGPWQLHNLPYHAFHRARVECWLLNVQERLAAECIGATTEETAHAGLV